jgi:hypothetical protein
MKCPALRGTPRLPVVTDPPETRRQLRGMAINTTTDWVEHLHDTALLRVKGDEPKERQDSGSGCVIPTRDLVVST